MLHTKRNIKLKECFARSRIFHASKIANMKKMCNNNKRKCVYTCRSIKCVEFHANKFYMKQFECESINVTAIAKIGLLFVSNPLNNCNDIQLLHPSIYVRRVNIRRTTATTTTTNVNYTVLPEKHHNFCYVN